MADGPKPGGSSGAHTYRAFISYSHRDKAAATRLHRWPVFTATLADPRAIVRPGREDERPRQPLRARGWRPFERRLEAIECRIQIELDTVRDADPAEERRRDRGLLRRTQLGKRLLVERPSFLGSSLPFG